MNLFAYGTLMRKGRMEALVGRKLGEPVPATLTGYRKYPTPRGYPIILPADGFEVSGVVWRIRAEDLPCLDHYEGYDEDPPFYLRREVNVTIDGKATNAWVYIGNQDIYWDIERV